MKQLPRPKFLCCKALVAACILLPRVAEAHFVWIEPDCTQEHCDVSVFFGEVNTGLRETRKTRLIERDGIEASLVKADGSEQPLPLEQHADRFQVKIAAAAAGGASIIAVDDEAPVVDYSKYGIGIVRPIFYARTIVRPGNKSFDPPAVSRQTLDVVPVGLGSYTVGAPSAFRVSFRGKPLVQRAEIRIYAPNGWSWEGEADKNGSVTFTPLWPGRYVADVIVREDVAGSFQGKPYEAIRHRATLSTEAVPAGRDADV